MRGLQGAELHMCRKHVPLVRDMLGYLARGKIFTKLDFREVYY